MNQMQDDVDESDLMNLEIEAEEEDEEIDPNNSVDLDKDENDALSFVEEIDEELGDDEEVLIEDFDELEEEEA